MYHTAAVGSVQYHQRCPACEKAGRDRSGDNLAVYTDGHVYCFACGYRKASPNSLSNAASRLGKSENGTEANLHRTLGIHAEQLSDCGGPDVHRAKMWLSSYGISDAEIGRYNLRFDHGKQLLLFPVLYKGIPVYYNGRYFGSDPKHPKYTGFGSRPIHPYSLGQGKVPRTLLCVEDWVSAIRIQETGFECVPLFGTSLSIDYLVTFAKKPDTILRIWLDQDKATLSVRHADRARQFLKDTGSIITEKDPKCYNEDMIRELVLNSTSGIS